jgi:probable addiction module antidote protein
MKNMAKLKTTPFEFSDYFKTPEQWAGFLATVIEDSNGDPHMIAAALGEIAKSEGMAKVAKKSGLSRESLYKTLSGDRNPSFGTLFKVITALGLQLHIVARS